MSDQTVYDHLDKIFHEPKRLGIVSSLCAAPTGLPFVSLKKALGLTDGNLSRHLSLLEEHGIVVLQKEFVAQKPRTTVLLTEKGHAEFAAYLQALRRVLSTATEALGEEEATPALPVRPLEA